jgi:ESCRT-I complex subunit TSG101
MVVHGTDSQFSTSIIFQLLVVVVVVGRSSSHKRSALSSSSSLQSSSVIMSSSSFVLSSSFASEFNFIVFGCLAGVYRDPSRIIKDAASLCSTDLGSRLHPVAELLIMNDGSESIMLMLNGTLHMTYQDNDYRIPIELYMPPLYPIRPPIIYVRPDDNMTIPKNHKHVGQDGMVYMPYLHDWNADTHDLAELAVLLSGIFGNEPPCYNKNNVDPEAREKERRKERDDVISEATLRVQSAMKSLCNRTKEDLRVELMYQRRLEAVKLQIDVLSEEGERRKAELVTENAELEKSTRELKRWLATVEEEKQRLRGPEYDNEESKRREDWDEGGAIIDLIAIPADTRSAQMLALSTESAAIDDCIYYLDMALESRKLTMEVYLREVRRLTKRQFLAKVNRSGRQCAIHFSPPITFGHLPPNWRECMIYLHSLTFSKKITFSCLPPQAHLMKIKRETQAAGIGDE